jgi:hypothetical protein
MPTSELEMNKSFNCLWAFEEHGRGRGRFHFDVRNGFPKALSEIVMEAICLSTDFLN